MGEDQTCNVTRSLKNLNIYSNFFYYLPIIVLLYNKRWVEALLLFFTPIASFIYHANKTNASRIIDYVFSFVYLVVTVFIFAWSMKSDPGQIELYIALLVAIAAFLFFFLHTGCEYLSDVYHVLWHVMGGFGSMCVAIAYVRNPFK